MLIKHQHTHHGPVRGPSAPVIHGSRTCQPCGAGHGEAGPQQRAVRGTRPWGRGPHPVNTVKKQTRATSLVSTAASCAARFATAHGKARSAFGSMHVRHHQWLAHPLLLVLGCAGMCAGPRAFGHSRGSTTQHVPHAHTHGPAAPRQCKSLRSMGMGSAPPPSNPLAWVPASSPSSQLERTKQPQASRQAAASWHAAVWPALPLPLQPATLRPART